jgi:fructose-bisphosphate aldolase class II
VKPAFTPNAEEEDKIVEIFKPILNEKNVEKRNVMFEKTAEDNKNDERLSKILAQVKEAQDLVMEEVKNGFSIFALDASFLPLKSNVVVTAYLDGFIPAEAGHQGEVGEIGGEKNTTPEEAVEFLEELSKYGIKLNRIAINNGTAHGHVYHEGKLVPTSLNLDVTKKVTEAIKPFDVTIVQHGVTGTPLHVLYKLREVGITEAHVGTNWQDIVLANLPSDLRNEMEEETVKKYADPKKSREEIVGKNIKNFFGKYRDRMIGIDAKYIEAINKATEKSALEYLEAFKSFGTAAIVRG